jgi:hypothetical protein
MPRWVVALWVAASWLCRAHTLFGSVGSGLDHGQRSTVAAAGLLRACRLPGVCKAAVLARSCIRGQSENDVDVGGDALSATAQLRAVLETLTGRTRTPDECYFCLWDGWGDIEGGGGARILDRRRWFVRRGPRIATAFPDSVLQGPKVVVPNRAYFLFRGSVSDFGDWGQRRCGRVGPDCICPTPRSSGQPTTPGMSPTTSIRTGPGSELISPPSTSSWLTHASTSSRPTPTMSSRITGRQHKDAEFRSGTELPVPGRCRRLLGSAQPRYRKPARTSASDPNRAVVTLSRRSSERSDRLCGIARTP